MSKIRNKTNSSNPKRAADIEKFGMDTKFAYHVVRLALECEQLLATQDLDLQRDREILKSIRRGEWSFERLETWFQQKESTLETLYASSSLRMEPNEAAIKDLLLKCLEHHYGNLDAAIARVPELDSLITDLQAVLARYRLTV